ncbi:centromere protein S [Parasteatoda tepidariorum]|nr:centromere protein S isoform X1 [Parasteatoda tepidariorum]XP_042904960.1 centromere protein S isoform X2 [Parasteatoda tepidariorum]
MGDFADEENLQTSIHFSVGKICADIATEYKVNFSKEFMATLADLTFHQASIFAEDLEAFAKHAKRTTVNSEDVKLLVRRSKSLHEHINEMAAELGAASAKPKSKKKVSEKKEENDDDVQIIS